MVLTTKISTSSIWSTSTASVMTWRVPRNVSRNVIHMLTEEGFALGAPEDNSVEDLFHSEAATPPPPPKVQDVPEDEDDEDEGVVLGGSKTVVGDVGVITLPEESVPAESLQSLDLSMKPARS